MGAAVGVKAIKDKYKLPGTIVVYGGPAEELLASRGYMVKAGAFEGVDAIMHVHVGSGFSVKYGYDNFGNISVEYRFKGQPAPDTDPLRGRSALDAAELFDTGMQYMREHGFDPEDARVQSVITEGGEQPNMVPGEVANWYFIRARTPALVQSILGWMREVAKNAAGMTRTEYSERILSGSWPFNANKALAEVADRNIQLVGMPKWSVDDVTFAKYFQKSMGTPQIGLRTKVEPLEHSSGHAGTSDIGDMAWHTPNVKIFMPSTIPGALAGHHWSAAVGPGTPISHKGMTAAAKVLAGTMIDLYTDPALVAGIKADFAAQIAAYPKWYSFIPDGAKPPTHINVEEMAKYRAALKPYEYDPNSKQTYLQFMKAPYPGPEPVAGAGRASNEPRTTFDHNSIGFEWKP
jgi:aminobenzoyl-glutamate utilization protein B